MAQFKSFFGIGVHFVAAQSKTKWTLAGSVKAGEQIDPTDAARVFTVDLGNRPAVVGWANATIDDLGVDVLGQLVPGQPDYALVGSAINILTVGPSWPGGSRKPGTVYLESTTFQQVRPSFDPTGKEWPPEFPVGTRWHEYQCESRHYDDGRRYHGFHAALLKVKGDFWLLDVFLVGDEARPRRLWVDSTDPDDCDQVPQATAFPTGPKADGSSRGPIYLALKRCAQLALRGPKQPPGGG